MTRPWEDYWSNPRGLSPAISAIWASRFCENYLRLAPPGVDEVVLDYGAGFGLVAVRLAAHFHRVLAYDPSPMMREALLLKAEQCPNLHVLDNLSDPPEKPHRAIINSVLQYVDAKGLNTVAEHLVELNPQHLAISDIVPPGYTRRRDAWQLFGDARRKGYLRTYLAHILREMFHHPSWHATAKLQDHAPETLQSIFRRHGWHLDKTSNFTPSRMRYTLIGSRQPL